VAGRAEYRTQVQARQTLKAEMTDVDQLRQTGRKFSLPECVDAADEIEQLRRECGEWVLKNAALHKRIALLEGKR
jgi:hypothetical protein